ncbi:protein bric-a-brac 1-like [Contarinia nasturtii]|uniref:protein bric-a-brac 1-like n=1 Tax=Contarinia nasturtii TaxID=265458 RepID=UPI0012D4B05C|nr:protein bric-a-brac 1-like [Contarinia nasturtii]
MSRENRRRYLTLESKNIHTRLFQNVLALDDFLDVTLSAGGKHIKAHRFILAAASEYFRKVLKFSNDSNNFPIFFFNDVKFEHMSKIVEYLYTGSIEIQSNDIDEFMRLAKRLQILGLHRPLDGDTDDLSIARSTPSVLLSSFDDTTYTNDIPHDISFNEPGSSREKKMNCNRNTSCECSIGSNEQTRTQRPRNRNIVPMVSEHTTDELSSNHKPTAAKMDNGDGQTKSRIIRRRKKLDRSEKNRKKGSMFDEMSTDSSTTDNQYKRVRSGKDRNSNKISGKWPSRKKTKQFHCPVCQSSFYLRLGLMNHFKKTSCNPPTDFDDDE